MSVSMNSTLDVAISLVFVYVLAALLASTVNELISGVLKLRGIYLTKAIEALTSLDTGNEYSWGGVGGWFDAHFCQSKPTVTAEIDRIAVSALAEAKRAEGIAGATAADVVTAVGAVADLDRLTGLRHRMNAAANLPGATPKSVVAVIQPIGEIADLQSHPLLVGTPSSLPSYVPARDFAAALLGVLKDGSMTSAFTQARNTIATLPDGDLKKTLQAFITSGANDIDKLRVRIENWFDDSMQRLSGIYTRASQYVMLAVGLVVAVGMNIDSIHVAKTLWDQPALSAAISRGAAQYVDAHKENYFGCTETPAAKVVGSDAADQRSHAAACQKMTLKAIQDVIDQQPLPIGRKGTDFFGFVCPAQPQGAAAAPAICAGAGWIAWTIVGWLVTALAISLGAQFWFGLLTQLVNLRAAGDKPDRTNKSA